MLQPTVSFKSEHMKQNIAQFCNFIALLLSFLVNRGYVTLAFGSARNMSALAYICNASDVFANRWVSTGSHEQNTTSGSLCRLQEDGEEVARGGGIRYFVHLWLWPPKKLRFNYQWISQLGKRFIFLRFRLCEDSADCRITT
jgi:hypothetical protein